MQLVAVLAAEENSATGVPLWLAFVVAMVLLWAVTAGALVWALLRLRSRTRR
jgi:hypothetical protein